ncbi:type VII secretion protein EccE [Mycobacterium sp. 1245111.1]|uniref:type VII secretion protein EccE n=1 Tax=Mycobacterium sp. 1245111.1 TaxID=1834073 RepID=UPI0007FC6739|nr:type VII secretion protein EccE [Mycobacterium sp. 1245111.1]OBK37011.1 type VII secretion protein EccE [Mycobacterium sp. 1245111.1]
MNDGRLGLALRLPNLMFLVIVAIATALTTALLGVQPPIEWEAWAAAAVAAITIGVLTYRSRTLAGWMHRRMTYRRSSRDTIAVYEAEGAGITWDGHRACTYIEVLPQPYATTILTGTRDSVIAALPIDDIREELVQFDIHCDAVTFVTIGHNYDRPNKAATAYQASIGPTTALLYGRTFIEVGITLSESLDSIYARTGTDDVPAGISRTVTIAAERIRRRVAHDGWKTQLLTKSNLEELHAAIAAQLNPALTQEHWSACGPKSMQAIAYTPGPGAWTTENYREWCRLNPHRQIHIARLERRQGADHAEMFIGLLTSDPRALNTVTALGLRREHGQQGDILTAALPLARTVRPTAIHGKALPEASPFPIPLVPGGIGTYIGQTANRSQVFVNFTVGAEPFYIFGPAAMCQQLFVWLSTSGRSIDIALPGDEWKEFATRLGVTHSSNSDADIVITTPQGLPTAAHPNQVRLVWTTTAPDTPPAYALIAGPDECTLHTPTRQIRYRWSVSSAEEAFFTLGRTRRTATPAPNTAAAQPQPGNGQSGAQRTPPAPARVTGRRRAAAPATPEPPASGQQPTSGQQPKRPATIRRPATPATPEPPSSGGRHSAQPRRP